jgi:signal transduction histidine kinase
VAGLLFFWHRSQLERRLAIERVRSRIATDLHDHIGASLSRIAMTIEVMRLQASASPDSGRMLGEIADTARSLIEDMSDIVWSIDPRRDTLGDLVGRLRAFGFGILEPRGIHWTFEAPEDSLHRSLAPGQRRQLYLILKEALHNVARHSQGLNAVLRIQFHGGDLRAEIEDDGRGYRHDAPKGLGIRSMQSRAEQLGGKLEIHSRPQGGTRVSLRFPLSVKDA